MLTPGNYVALNLTGNRQPGFAPFTVTQSSPRPPCRRPATQASIEFGFRGPTVLHDGWMVRAENQGYLVHMISFAGVPSAKAGRKVIALLKAGEDNAAFKLTNGHFFDLLGPASPGAMQQEVVTASPATTSRRASWTPWTAASTPGLGWSGSCGWSSNADRWVARATPARPAASIMNTHLNSTWRWPAALALGATAAIHLALVPGT